MRKQPRARQRAPQQGTGDPASDRKRCDKLPHLRTASHRIHSADPGAEPVHTDFRDWRLVPSIFRFANLPMTPGILRLRISTIALTLALGLARVATAQQTGIVTGKAVDQTGGSLPGITIDLV